MNASAVTTDLGRLLQRYFCSYLINQRRLSSHTIASYRDMFRLLLPFIATQLHIRTHHEHLFLSIVNTDSYRT